jgi:S-adenosylmethionine-diacylgycerolhomoserine-N-methlytransferase
MYNFTESEKEQNKIIDQYYKFQSKIYDLTRWSFLFGRKEIIRKLPELNNPVVVEIGCGTGYNLKNLIRKYPDGTFYGIDLSPDMIKQAQKNLSEHQNKVTLLQKPYSGGHTLFDSPVNLILFSYSLTMINPQWKELIDQAMVDLKQGGIIAVTDFHDSRNDWFKSHMSHHHVRMDGHLLDYLHRCSQTLDENVGSAYFGIWNYFWYIGKK